MHGRERRYHARDNNRVVRPFAWGLEFIAEHVNGDDPRQVLLRHSDQAMQNSEDFYGLRAIDDFDLDGDYLTWTSAIHTPDAENNIARARYFPVEPKKPSHARTAIVVLPQWNAQAESQAVLDTRAAVRWLKEEAGYERIGILGTSIGSCIAFLAFCHDPAIEVGVFNHVSGYVADVVWQGISTQHVRAGIAGHLSVDDLRVIWKPISPVPFIPRLLHMESRPMRFISARYDLTFPVEMSHQVIDEVRQMGLDLDVVWLPCGHYSLAEMPWKALDAWKIATFFRKHLRGRSHAFAK